MYTVPFIQGFGICAGLIIAIGAQNAFVLAQSIKGEHRFLVAGICSMFDIVLITVGVAGVGALVAMNPLFSKGILWAGAIFLAVYGALALRSAVRGGKLEAADAGESTMKGVVLTTMAVTLLNPHAYLDTVVLMGGLSTQFEGAGKLWFTLGAVSASILWFFTLSMSGRALAPLFRKPIAWRLLDGVICATMWGIAASLVFNDVTQLSE